MSMHTCSNIHVHKFNGLRRHQWHTKTKPATPTSEDCEERYNVLVRLQEKKDFHFIGSLMEMSQHLVRRVWSSIAAGVLSSFFA